MASAMKCTRTVGYALLTTLLLSSAVSCAKKKKDAAADAPAAATSSASGSSLKFQPDAAQQKVVDELLAKLNRETWRFPSKDTNAPENARLFTHIAATATDPAVVGAALSAMYGAYSSHSKRKATPDSDFALVVDKHLRSQDPKLATRALLAARTGIAGKDGSEELIRTVVSLASQEPYRDGPGRYAIIDTLRVVSANQRTKEVVQILEESLDSKNTYVVSYALQALYRATRSIENRDALKAKALGMTAHEDPGIRGRAIELLGALGRDDAEVLKVVLKALSDAHPYVRSEAAEAIARLRHRPAIHALVKLVDDKESNRYDIRDWSMLDGKPGRLHHDGSPWSRVYDAAMNAIRSLSEGAVELDRVNPKEIEKTLDKNAATTKAWYAKERKNIPPLDLESPALAGAAEPSAEESVQAAPPKPRSTSVPRSPAPVTPAPPPAASP